MAADRTSEPVVRISSRCWRRRASRRTSWSRLTPSIPDSSLSRAPRLPSFPGRTSAAAGSMRAPAPLSAPAGEVRALGKHSSVAPPGWSEANGSPATIRARTRSSPCRSLNCLTSSLTHADRAAAGEQMTISQAESRRASRIRSPSRAEAANSSRSRKTGRKRGGARPAGVWIPTIREGTVQFSNPRRSHPAHRRS